jgi:hypothetical protein
VILAKMTKRPLKWLRAILVIAVVSHDRDVPDSCVPTPPKHCILFRCVSSSPLRGAWGTKV